MDVSVIICCYNSVNRLDDTLKCIKNQKTTPDINWELIVVDNNSSDGTAEFVKKTLELLNFYHPFKIVFEKRSGLSFARECGFLNSEGKIIIFCDDDNYLREDYVQNAYQLMKINLSTVIIGSENIPICSEYYSESNSYREIMSLYLAAGNSIKSELKNASFVYGAGMVIRKHILEAIYQNSNINLLLSGRTKNSLSSGEDSELCILVKKSGLGKIALSSKLVLHHNLPDRRFQSYYLKKLVFNIGYSTASLKAYDYCIMEKYQFRGYVFKYFIRIIREIFTIIILSRNNALLPRIRVYLELGKLKYILVNICQLKRDASCAQRNIILLKNYQESIT